MGEKDYVSMQVLIGVDGKLIPLDEIETVDLDDEDVEIEPIDISGCSFSCGLRLNNEQKVMLRKDLKRMRAFANRLERRARREKRKKKEAKKKARKEKFRNDLSGVQ